MDGMASVVASPERLSIRQFVNSADDLHNADALRARAGETGYLFFRGLLDPSLVRRLRREILGLFAARGWLTPGTSLMQGIVAPRVVRDASADELTTLQVQIQLLDIFRRIRIDPSITDVLERLFQSRPCEGYGDVCRIVAPDMLHRTTLPHQDHFFTKGSTSQWTVWIPVGACPGALGGLAVWPGSHREGLRAHERPIDEGHAMNVGPEIIWHSTNYRSGDVLMFNALTVHRARPNLTADRVRLSVDYRYVAESLS